MEDNQLRKSLLSNDFGADNVEPAKQAPIIAQGTDGGKPELSRSKLLFLSLFAPILVGLGNKIFIVLMYIPMYNYPLFVNLFTTMFFIPVCFAYIIPMIKYGHAITPEQRAIPQRKWAIMGLLDSISGIMNSLAVNYIQNGSLVTLVGQANIPISLFLSWWLLKMKLNRFQIIGSGTIIVGLLIVMIPQFTKSGGTQADNLPIWCMLLILSCIPGTLSNIYKEKSVGEIEIDPVYLNGWVAVWQTIFAIPILLPSAPASNLAIADIPSNLWNGLRCFGGINSVTEGSHPDSCGYAAAYMLSFLFFNITYNFLLIVVLKVAGTTVLYLSATLLIPLSNVVFSLKFMPQSRTLGWNDIVGMLFIMAGLFIYRFLNRLYSTYILKEDPEAKLQNAVAEEARAEEPNGVPLEPVRAESIAQTTVYVRLPDIFAPEAKTPDKPTDHLSVPRQTYRPSTASNQSRASTGGKQWTLNSQGTLIKRHKGTAAAMVATKSIIDLPEDL